MGGSKSPQEWVAELIGNDRPIHLGALDVIGVNLSAGLGIAGAAEGLRDLMLDILYADPDAYKGLVQEFTPDAARDQSQTWYARAKVTRREFDGIDWVAMVHTVGDDDVIARYTNA